MNMSIEKTSGPESVVFRDTNTFTSSLAHNFELKPGFFDNTQALERAKRQQGLQDVDAWLNGLQVKHDAPTLVADIPYDKGRYNISLKTNGDLPDNEDPNIWELSLAALVKKEAKLKALDAMSDEIPVAYASLRAKIKNELTQVKEDNKTFAKHVGGPVIPNLKSLSKDSAPAIKISRKGIVNGVLTTTEIAALTACAVFTNDIPAHTELPQNTRYTATIGEVSPKFHYSIVEQVEQDNSLTIVKGAEFSITLDDGDPSTPPITVELEAVADKKTGDTGFITDGGKILGIDNGVVNPKLFSIYDTQSGLTVIDADIKDIDDGDDKVELRYYPYALTPVTDLPGYDGKPIKINQKTTWLTGVRQRRAAAAPAASPTVAPELHPDRITDILTNYNPPGTDINLTMPTKIVVDMPLYNNQRNPWHAINVRPSYTSNETGEGGADTMAHVFFAALHLAYINQGGTATYNKYLNMVQEAQNGLRPYSEVAIELSGVYNDNNDEQHRLDTNTYKVFPRSVKYLIVDGNYDPTTELNTGASIHLENWNPTNNSADLIIHVPVDVVYDMRSGQYATAQIVEALSKMSHQPTTLGFDSPLSTIAFGPKTEVPIPGSDKKGFYYPSPIIVTPKGISE